METDIKDTDNNTSMQWFCYCNVNVYVVISFLLLFISALSMGPNYLSACTQAKGLIPPHIFSCPNVGPEFPSTKCVIFCVQWFQVRGVVLLILVEMLTISVYLSIVIGLDHSAAAVLSLWFTLLEMLHMLYVEKYRIVRIGFFND